MLQLRLFYGSLPKIPLKSRRKTYSMLKKIIYLVLVAIPALMFYSCSSVTIVPQATNTIAPISFENLNLERNDYTILNTITAEATIKATFKKLEIKVEDVNGGFSMTWINIPKKGWIVDDVDGVLDLGYLSNDYDHEMFEIGPYPHWVVRRLAIYRLINAAKLSGADGVIEPLISTNVEEAGRREIIYKTTVTAKAVKIKPDQK